MRKTLFLLLLALFVSACSASVSSPQGTAIAPTASATLAASPPLTVTSTLGKALPIKASPTYNPPSIATASATHTKYIFPFTPTLDIRNIVTVTSAPKGQCPKEDPAITINLTAPLDDVERKFQVKRGHLILDALNEGLSISVLKTEIEKQKKEIYLHTYYQDVTGDGVKDFILFDYGNILDVFYCIGGKYELFALEDDPEFYPWRSSGIWEIVDRNQNGLPEIVYYQLISGTHSFWEFHIYEWNSKTFVDLTDTPDIYYIMATYLPKRTTKEDINHDGLTDLVFTDGGPDDRDLWAREKTTTYSWNGQFYIRSYVSYAKPQYRYQATQDGDRETFYGHYQKAIAFYQEAIFNPDLDWMSLERLKYQIAMSGSKYRQPSLPTPTVYPKPIPDETEYPRLAAYAYYRMMILHTYLGEMDAAQTQYTTIQTKFPASSPGHPYAEMAAAFWDAYQHTQEIPMACAAAIKYVRGHQDMLDVLQGAGGDEPVYYYAPEEICPFR